MPGLCETGVCWGSLRIIETHRHFTPTNTRASAALLAKDLDLKFFTSCSECRWLRGTTGCPGQPGSYTPGSSNIADWKMDPD